jgi:hypothetical protein
MYASRLVYVVSGDDIVPLKLLEMLHREILGNVYC